jgi:hypothetical protein
MRRWQRGGMPHQHSFEARAVGVVGQARHTTEDTLLDIESLFQKNRAQSSRAVSENRHGHSGINTRVAMSSAKENSCMPANAESLWSRVPLPASGRSVGPSGSVFETRAAARRRRRATFWEWKSASQLVASLGNRLAWRCDCNTCCSALPKIQMRKV